jgi:hypothetical protein
MILAHSLRSDFFGLDEISAPYPDFVNFNIFPATDALLAELRGLDDLAGQSSVDHFGCWQQPSGKILLCTKEEAARVRMTSWIARLPDIGLSCLLAMVQLCY